ncbi:E3 ubiquitin-protein ligase RNFT1 isoform X2 [Tachysurus fulvidraco]|uniref:E3 ubiquitin-protein ligase RNFT1 isoform X2 n=1 Tax=Tachysurus fulvidraco TaxID=1234273 RepID=UPI000F50F199|nr:E3 ubiquitin-protein ligase RNFT1 isoform X2 [Tachysurus fulvidraco]
MGNLEYQGMFGIYYLLQPLYGFYGIWISPTVGYCSNYQVISYTSYKFKWTFFLKGCQIVGHVRNDSHFRSAVEGCWAFRESCREFLLFSNFFLFRFIIQHLFRFLNGSQWVVMKPRLQYGRRASHEFRCELTSRESTGMPTELSSQDGTGLSFTLQPELVTSSRTANTVENTDDRVSIDSSLTGEEHGTRSASRRLRPAGISHSHSHSRSRSHIHAEASCSHTDLEAGEHSASISDLRYLICWVQKSLPFIIIICSKLILQHALGLAVGVGLFITFLHVNKNIQAQVVLQDRRSKLQCFCVLSFLMASSLLLYYTFEMDSLYYCLILMNPRVEPMDIWKVFWTVGVTSFIVKFVFMGLKCLILLLPSCVMVYRRRGQCYMFIEELGQFYQVITPVPPWFHYLLTSKMVDDSLEVTMDILLALLYIILKLLEIYSRWGSLQNAVQNFLTLEVNGTPASQSQCCSAGDLCLICQSNFKQPRVLLCQAQSKGRQLI